MIKPNTINNEYGQTTANDDEVCDVAEFAYNGGPIDWTYWQDRKATPHQAAKLANCIDPITWPGNEYEQGTIPKAMQEKIQRLEEWLAERNDQWTLSALVDALGTDAAPYSMREYAARNAIVLSVQPVAKVSKAPPPIKPISGTGWSSPRVTTRAPDWDFWRHVRRAEVWQVCALSLNIDPDSLERGAYGQWRGFASNEVAERFDKRIRLYSNVTNTLAHSEITLSDFAAWAVKEMKWSDLPPELVALAQQPAKQLAPESAAAPSGAPEKGAPVAKKESPATVVHQPEVSGVPTAAIIEKFKLEPEQRWKDKLSRVDDDGKAYKDAIAQRGGRGKGSNTWNPAKFARCLIQAKERKLTEPLRKIIKNEWVDWLPEFDDLVLDQNGEN